ncbi:MAG: TPR end-of-group domain-containing protein [Vicinamibacteria bacterium]
MGCFYSIAGEREKALDCLERSLEVGTISKDWVEHDSDLDPIRDDPRFRALQARL